MTFYLTFLALTLLPFLLGVHRLVVPGLFWLRRRGVDRVLPAFAWFGMVGLALSACYTWAVLGGLSQLDWFISVCLSIYTGLIAVAWLVLLQRGSRRPSKPVMGPRNPDSANDDAR
ncbi:MAG: hypothetical protein Kow0020_06070 [Wenzhouxiangellaceae bacterium]